MDNLIIKDKSLIRCYYDVANIKIPDGVKIIESFAFKGRKIKSVEIPDSVELICCNAFEDCLNLTTVRLPKNIKRISASCFSGCESLKEINIPNGVTKIGVGAFNYCISLKKVNIAKSVKFIGKSAFDNCYTLKKIDIPTECYIAEYAFYGCSSLWSINFNSIKHIGYNSFSHCGKLKEIKVNVTSQFSWINLRAFAECECVTFSYNGEKVAYKAFYRDYNTSKNKYELRCRDFVYEEGKTYTTNNAVLCECGFHACINILDVFNYYEGSSSKIEIHEVKIGGKVDWCEDDSKICCTKITIGRKLSIHDVFEIFNKQQKNKNL